MSVVVIKCRKTSVWHDPRQKLHTRLKTPCGLCPRQAPKPQQLAHPQAWQPPYANASIWAAGFSCNTMAPSLRVKPAFTALAFASQNTPSVSFDEDQRNVFRYPCRSKFSSKPCLAVSRRTIQRVQWPATLTCSGCRAPADTAPPPPDN